MKSQVIEYLKAPPDAATLRDLLAVIGITARELVRTGEAEFKENFKDREMTEAQRIAALAAHPVLIERPIVVAGNRAVVGRPAGEGAGHSLTFTQSGLFFRNLKCQFNPRFDAPILGTFRRLSGWVR